jgi:hypothetical protein
MEPVQEPARHRFTVHDFHRMADAGILDEDSRVELIEGEVVRMPPIGVSHATLVNRLNRLLVHAVGDRGVVSVQNPVRLSSFSEPQPDLVVLVPEADRLTGDHPGPAETLLLIEVADTTLAWDLGPKLALYARSGLREVWVVDVGAAAIECFRGPSGESWEARERLVAGGVARPRALPDVGVPVADLFA